MPAPGSEAAFPVSPLHQAQAGQHAAFGEVDGWLMPRVYENIKMEYLAGKGTVGVMDRSHCGRLRVTGAQRLDLLQRLTTNDLRGLAAGTGTQTVMLTDKGRILDDLRLYAGENDLLLLTSAGNAAAVRAHIEKYRFRDDVAVEDVTSATAMISLYGPQSAHLLEWLTGAKHLADLPLHHVASLTIDGLPLRAARTADVGGSGFHLILEAGAAPRVWVACFERGASHGVAPLGEEAWEMLRIEWGVPRFGREITQERNPLEAGLDAGISFTKGCYIGQEVVARLESRQKVARQLVGLWLEPGPAPSEGSPIEASDRPGLAIGTLTSAAPSLDFRRLLGLGYVGTERSAPGVRLEVISDGDRIGAVVASLPFKSSEIPEPRAR